MNNNKILSLDMNRVRSLMANCKNKRHRALKIPNLTPDTYIQSLVQDHADHTHTRYAGQQS